MAHQRKFHPFRETVAPRSKATPRYVPTPSNDPIPQWRSKRLDKPIVGNRVACPKCGQFMGPEGHAVHEETNGE